MTSSSRAWRLMCSLSETHTGSLEMFCFLLRSYSHTWTGERPGLQEGAGERWREAEPLRRMWHTVVIPSTGPLWPLITPQRPGTLPGPQCGAAVKGSGLVAHNFYIQTSKSRAPHCYWFSLNCLGKKPPLPCMEPLQ